MRSTTDSGPVRRACFLALTMTAMAFLPMACGPSGPEMARVSGKVTYKGAPVTKGTVSFVATEPGHRNATGQLDSSGNYNLQTENPGDGAELGNYEVSIYSHNEQVLDYIPKNPVKAERLVPEKYENPKTSGLKATVKSGTNTFDFPLTDE